VKGGGYRPRPEPPGMTFSESDRSAHQTAGLCVFASLLRRRAGRFTSIAPKFFVDGNGLCPWRFGSGCCLGCACLMLSKTRCWGLVRILLREQGGGGLFAVGTALIGRVDVALLRFRRVPAADLGLR